MESMEFQFEASNLLWSDEHYGINDFVDKFTLPQIVKVQEGYYGPDEDSCLGAEQVLFIHALKHTEKVLARDRRRRELHIPLNCSRKVEERPANTKDVYDRVSEIARLFPKYVRVTQGYYSLDDESSCINPGDKLEIRKIMHGENGAGGSTLMCSNQERFPVKLNFGIVAGFQPLVDGREYYLKELVSTSQRPFYFQFVDPPNVGTKGESSVFNSGLGVLKCERIYTDSTVICSTKEGRDRTIVTFPKELQVTVAAAQGALIGDKDYMRVCRFFHDGVNLTRIEHMDTHNVFASRATIREYLYHEKLQTEPPSPDSENTSFPGQAEGASKIQEASSTKVAGSSSDEIRDDDDDYAYYVQPHISEEEFDKFAKIRTGNNNEQIGGSRSTLEAIATEDKKINSSSDNASSSAIVEDLSYVTMNAANHNTVIQKSPEPQATQERKPEILPMAPIPDDLSELTIEEVSQVLMQVRLQEFVKIFEYNQIDGDMLVSMVMDEEVLKSLGMNAFQRKKLLKLVDGWRPKVSSCTTKL